VQEPRATALWYRLHDPYVESLSGGPPTRYRAVVLTSMTRTLSGCADHPRATALWYRLPDPRVELMAEDPRATALDTNFHDPHVELMAEDHALPRCGTDFMTRALS